MFSIGEFARLGAVSIRTLRHYDEIGLLAPADVDPVTGYRSYSAKQLRQLNRIVALKDLGLALGQIRQLLDGITVEELRGMLLMRRAQLERERQQQRHHLLESRHGSAISLRRTTCQQTTSWSSRFRRSA